MQGLVIHATLILTHLGQGHHDTYRGAKLTGRIEMGELIEAALSPGEDDEKVTHAKITSVDDRETKHSRGGQ